MMSKNTECYSWIDEAYRLLSKCQMFLRVSATRKVVAYTGQWQHGQCNVMYLNHSQNVIRQQSRRSRPLMNILMYHCDLLIDLNGQLYATYGFNFWTPSLSFWLGKSLWACCFSSVIWQHCKEGYLRFFPGRKNFKMCLITPRNNQLFPSPFQPLTLCARIPRAGAILIPLI